MTIACPDFTVLPIYFSLLTKVRARVSNDLRALLVDCKDMDDLAQEFSGQLIMTYLDTIKEQVQEWWNLNNVMATPKDFEYAMDELEPEYGMGLVAEYTAQLKIYLDRGTEIAKNL